MASSLMPIPVSATSKINIMLLKDFLIFSKNEMIAPLAKMIRLEIPKEMKKQIEKEHLYHITPNEEIANTGFPNSSLIKSGTS